MFKKFISYYKPHKKMFALDMIASLFISLIGLGYPMITNKMLEILFLRGIVFLQIKELLCEPRKISLR